MGIKLVSVHHVIKEGLLCTLYGCDLPGVVQYPLSIQLIEECLRVVGKTAVVGIGNIGHGDETSCLGWLGNRALFVWGHVYILTIFHALPFPPCAQTLCETPFTTYTMPRIQYPLVWSVGHAESAKDIPTTMVPATVPGAVQLDWAKATGMPDYKVGDNFKQYAWTWKKYWRYRTELSLPNLKDGERLYFVSKGIDYDYDILLDNKLIYSHEGMFTPVEIDLTGKVTPGALLEILIKPAPDSGDRSTLRSPANSSAKPAVSYGWDWHPTLIPLGIWDETYLEVRPESHFRDVDFDYVLEDDLTVAHITLSASLSRLPAGARVEFILDGPDGGMVLRQSQEANETVFFMPHLPCPQLWWPHDHGAQNRYTATVRLLSAGNTVIDTRQVKTGFRKVRLVMHENAWDMYGECPATQHPDPFTLEINNRAIFAKGSNWVAPEIFPGLITEETYRPLLEAAKGAHFNLLRSWGGAMLSKDSFFDLCDALGLMVWQEFPLSCNCHPDKPEYIQVLDKESRSMIARVRHHPCRVLWCGGNELFNSWSRMTEQSHALRLLNRNCFDLDRHTPFIYTSPIYGVRHGDYRFLMPYGEDAFAIFQRHKATAYVEYGCPGPADADYLRTFIPEEELFPPREGTAWEWHHALKAWDADLGSWLFPETIAHYFGEADSLEALVAQGQWLQCEGYKALFEEARRQKPVCSMALNWCYNEPWPCAANNSIISYPNRLKSAYYAVKAACRPVMASARIPKFDWKQGEVFSCELWLLNDRYKAEKAGEVRAELQVDDGQPLPLGSWKFSQLEPNKNQQGPAVSLRLPDTPFKKLTLRLRVVGRPDWDSSYELIATRV